MNFINFTVKFENYETMIHDALLGRDFTSRKDLRKIIIKIMQLEDETVDFIDSLMSINLINSQIKTNEHLDICADVPYEIKQKITEIYEKEYSLKPDSEKIANEPEMIIHLKHEQPIGFRSRRLSFSDKEQLRSLLDDLIKNGTIKPSNSPYASPIVLTRKKNGEIRFCVDYRELNKISVKDNFPTPLIEDYLDQLKNKKHFSKLDLKNGFHHVKMADSSVKYTSFVTPIGQYEFLKMPFGLTNAPRVFQRYLNSIFDQLIRDSKILLYLDDILIATENVEEHLDILKEVFQIAYVNHLKFRLDKCSFLYTEITYLGYLINEHGIRPSTENVEAIVNYPTPRNAKEVQRFLGIAGFFRRFVQNFSIIAKPLYDILKKDSKFKFGAEENEAFETLREKLTSYPILAVYSPHLETELHCDASATGFGAILMQKQRNEIFKPVAYFSHRTTPLESKFHRFELECLASVYAIKSFHVYLYGIKFKIIIDCDSFNLTLKKQNMNPRISRWAMVLQNYNYEIQHRSGKRMGHVDALSRCHGVLILEANTFEKVLAIKQDQDAEITKIREKLQQSEDKFFELRVPESIITNVIRTCHDDLGHVGFDKVVQKITTVYWFPKLRERVKEHIANCLKCIEFSPKRGKKEVYLHSISKNNVPFDTIHIDHYGPLEKTGKGYKHIFSIIDAFTKFIRLYPCKSTKTEEVIKHLSNYFRDYGTPKRIISDRETSFTSGQFSNFLEERSIKHIKIAVDTPRANGQVERFNKDLTPMLAKLSGSPDKWDTVLEKVEFSINNTVCRSTGEKPSKLLFGVNQTGEVNDKIRQVLESMSSSDRNLDEMRNSASEKIVKCQVYNERAYNRKHKEATVYKVGDYVMVLNTDSTPGVNKKLIPGFKGPYVVKKVLEHDRYIVGDIEGFQLTQMPYNGTVGPDQMKHWVRQVKFF